MTLVALFTMTAGAWAQDVKLNVTELTEDMVTGWSEDETLITPADLINFKDVTLEQAKAWTGAPSSGVAILAYGFNGTAIKLATFNNGSFANHMTTDLKRKQAYSYLSQYKIYYTSFVAINEAKTEATFTMPTSDVTVNYELVRDITQKVNVETRIDGAATERIRIAKDNDGHYKFATKQGWQFAAVDKLDNNKDLTNGELTYTLKMKVGDEYVAKNFDTELCPGTWRLEATANAEKPYEGTAYGPDIELYAGYEITVPAGEYATFYKDENLYTEDENAELYTISEVNATQAVLSDAIKVAPAETPLLVYNKSEQDKTFLLIPTEDEANQVTAANEFKGTLSTMGMPGSTSITDYYVCTGKAFRWVKNAGTIGANKCWLQIGEQPATTRANTRSIVGGGNTTGIDGIENDESAVEGYYDLNGRKLQGKPTRGGIYIQNGRKVIVR